MKVILCKLNFKVKISQSHCKEKTIKMRSVPKSWQQKVREFGFLVQVWWEEGVCVASKNLKEMNNSPIAGLE
jgi:hypothetical protein